MRKLKSVYLDCEWFANQNFSCSVPATTKQHCDLLYGRTLTGANINRILKDVDTIYFYGPDIAYIEKKFNIELRENYRCINLLSVFRHYAPRLKSHKLAYMEKLASIRRETMQYKSNIWSLYDDWKDPRKRKRCLRYNGEDVINLLRVKKWFFKKYGLRKSDALAFCL